jgi:hypothetical protein
MDQPVVFLPNGIEVARGKFEPIIAQMPDDERTGTDLMRAYFHVYLNVRFIGQSNVLIAVFQDLMEAGCEYRDVMAGIVEAHKRLGRSPRWINVLKDMQPNHVVVYGRDDEEAGKQVYALVRPPRNNSVVKQRPATHVVEKVPEESSEPTLAVTNGSSSQESVPE